MNRFNLSNSASVMGGLLNRSVELRAGGSGPSASLSSWHNKQTRSNTSCSILQYPSLPNCPSKGVRATNHTIVLVCISSTTPLSIYTSGLFTHGVRNTSDASWSFSITSLSTLANHTASSGPSERARGRQKTLISQYIFM